MNTYLNHYTFLTGYNGNFNVTNSNIKIFFRKTITGGDDFNQITSSPRAYEQESLDAEVKGFIFDEGHFKEADYPFTLKPIFSTLGSIIEISPQGPIISFVFDDSIKNLLGFNETIIYKEYNLSQRTVDILSFENIFLECDIAQGINFRGKRSGIILYWTMTVDPG